MSNRLTHNPDHREDLEIIRQLIDQPCKKTLISNSLKFRFGCDLDKRGTAYIWIDEPWQLYQDDTLITDTEVYYQQELDIEQWENSLFPLMETHLRRVEWTDEKMLILTFDDQYQLRLPHTDQPADARELFHHWYAKVRKPGDLQLTTQ